MLPFTVRPSYAMLAWRLKAHITASFRVWNPRQLGKITAICPRTFPANVESGENFSVSTCSTEHAGLISVFPQNFPQPPQRFPRTPACVHARAIFPRNPHFLSKSCVVFPGKTHFYPNGSNPVSLTEFSAFWTVGCLCWTNNLPLYSGCIGCICANNVVCVCPYYHYY